MKGIVSSWIWIIGGLSVALIFMATASQFLGYLSYQTAKSGIEADYLSLKNMIDTACDSSESESYFYEAKVPDIAIVYLSDSKIMPKNLTGLAESNMVSEGAMICISMKKEGLICSDIACRAEMPYLHSPESISSIIDRASGQRNYKKYQLSIYKSGGKVSIMPGA